MKKFAKPVVQLTAVAALVLAVAGVAYAANPDAHGVVHGCVNQRTHVLTVAPNGTCGRGTTGISWNERGAVGARGVAGARGPAGAPGAPGAPGAAGVVSAYTATKDGVALSTANLFFETVTSPMLPAGQYAWTAAATLHTSDTTADHESITCRLLRPDRLENGVGAKGVLVSEQTFSYSGTVTLTTGQALSYGCASNGNGGLHTTALEATITLVPVHSVITP